MEDDTNDNSLNGLDTAPNTATSTPENSTGGGADISGWEIATGILSLGLVTLGIGLYNHYNERKAMQKRVENMVRDAYDQLLTEKAEAKLKAIDDREYTPEEIKKAKYELTQQEIDEATTGDKNRDKVIKKTEKGLLNEYKTFGDRIKHLWRISGGITAVGLIALAVTLTVATGGMAIGLSIGLGIVGALVVGFSTGALAQHAAKQDTSDFMKKALDNPELRKGNTKAREQAQEAEKEKLSNKVLGKSKDKSKAQETNGQEQQQPAVNIEDMKNKNNQKTIVPHEDVQARQGIPGQNHMMGL